VSHLSIVIYFVANVLTTQLLALFTGGEANHNYHHCFPKDYRNGPQTLDWDPTKSVRTLSDTTSHD
jgi:fatty-acid desaturase